MINLLKKIRDLLIMIVIFGALTATLDYSRMKSGLTPIFNISNYNENTKIQSYRGLFYQASRKVKVSTDESLVDSSEIEYTVLNRKISIPKQYKDQERDITIETSETENCTSPSILYYADSEIKVYTYCLDKINIKENNKTKALLSYLEKDNKILKDIDYKLAYTGMYNDNSTLMYSDLYNLSNHGLTMYRCNKENINDIYFAPKDTAMQPDFCTYKDDDFKFIFEIHEDPDSNTDNSNTQKEVSYEDEQYRYEFDKPTLDRITITTPAVRGKAETSIPLRQVLASNLLTIDELEKKGLKFTKIDKAKEQAANQENTVNQETNINQNQ